jgi:hypothetical protein
LAGKGPGDVLASARTHPRLSLSLGEQISVGFLVISPPASGTLSRSRGGIASCAMSTRFQAGNSACGKSGRTALVRTSRPAKGVDGRKKEHVQRFDERALLANSLCTIRFSIISATRRVSNLCSARCSAVYSSSFPKSLVCRSSDAKPVPLLARHVPGGARFSLRDRVDQPAWPYPRARRNWRFAVR